MTLLFHPRQCEVSVGQFYAILDLPTRAEGCIAQVIAIQTLDFDGVQGEAIQRTLEEHLTTAEMVINRERGMNALRCLKVAHAKIRRAVCEGCWEPWQGQIPSRQAAVQLVPDFDLARRVSPMKPRCPLRPFVHMGAASIIWDGMQTEGTTVITGNRGSGKSHTAKQMVISLCGAGVPVFVYDFNAEFTLLPGAQVCRWKDNFRLHLGEVGHGVLRTVVRSLCPLPASGPSEAIFDNTLPAIFRRRRAECQQEGVPFTVDVQYLRDHVSWSRQGLVQDAIRQRLDLIADIGLFAQADELGGASLNELWESACAGNPVIFDLSSLSDTLRETLVKAVGNALERQCDLEVRRGTRRFPYLVADEAHFYIKEDAILGLITRGRHIGISTVFVTNTPDKLPTPVFRDLDSLILLTLPHRSDHRAVGMTAVLDEDTVQAMGPRLRPRTALISGRMTNGLPVLVSIDPMPPHVPVTGQTRSPWGRFAEADAHP